MRESRALEFKREVSRTFLKTVSAFANFGTGEVWFGVEDDGTIVGVSDAKATSLDIENAINDAISPQPRYTLDVRIEGGKELVVLRVFEGKDKPYLYRGKAYRRSDTADVEVDRIELNRLILEGQNRSFEEVRSEVQDLTFETLRRELLARAEIDAVDENVLRTLRLYSTGEGFNNAAAILADANRFPGIDIVRFGSSINEIADRKRCVGVSALDQLAAALEMHDRYYRYEKIEGATREMRERVPREAYREAVANALVHRLWDVSANVQISMEDTGITVTSPGGLPRGISEREYLEERVSILRNPIIGNVFYRLDYIESFGTGVERIRKAYEPFEVAPVFSVTENLIVVKLPVTDRLTNVTGDELAVLECFTGGRLLSRREVEDMSGFGQAKVGRLLNGLVDQGRLRRVGKNRNTRYALS